MTKGHWIKKLIQCGWLRGIFNDNRRLFKAIWCYNMEGHCQKLLFLAIVRPIHAPSSPPVKLYRVSWLHWPIFPPSVVHPLLPPSFLHSHLQSTPPLSSFLLRLNILPCITFLFISIAILAISGWEDNYILQKTFCSPHLAPLFSPSEHLDQYVNLMVSMVHQEKRWKNQNKHGYMHIIFTMTNWNYGWLKRDDWSSLLWSFIL